MGTTDLDDFMSQHEYSVGLARPRTKEELSMVRDAYLLGKKGERERILKILSLLSSGGIVSEALFSLVKRIEEENTF